MLERVPVLKNHFFYRCSANPMIRQRELCLKGLHGSQGIRAPSESYGKFNGANSPVVALNPGADVPG